jgi:hypothetical protein
MRGADWGSHQRPKVIPVSSFLLASKVVEVGDTMNVFAVSGLAKRCLGRATPHVLHVMQAQWTMTWGAWWYMHASGVFGVGMGSRHGHRQHFTMLNKGRAILLWMLAIARVWPSVHTCPSTHRVAVHDGP